jgi:hypothetical protein
MYTRIHMYHTIYMKCTVLLVFSCVFKCRNMYFWFLLHVYKNLHVPYFIHGSHSCCSVFIFFTADTSSFGSFYMYTRIHMYHTLFIECIVPLVFSFVFTLEQCSFGAFHIYTRIHMYDSINM